jgi:hypothetical protein
MTKRTTIVTGVLAATLILPACEDALLIDPAPAPAVVGVHFAVAGGANAGGPGAAFDKVDSVHVAVFKAAEFDEDWEENFTDEFVPVNALVVTSGRFTPEAETRVRVEIELKQDFDTLFVIGALTRSGDPLFLGAAPVLARRGEVTAAPVTLIPIPHLAVGTVPPITAIGETERINAAVIFATGDTIPGYTITFTSSNPAVANVDASGRVTARREGRIDVTVRAEGADFELEETVPVTVAATVSSIEITPSPATVDVGATVQLSATARDRRNNALDRSFNWSSSATNIASVDDNTGRVTGVSAGMATITARSSGASSSVSVTVVERPRIELSRDDVRFTMLLGDPDPGAQTVAITNPGGGTLAGLSAGPVQYTGTADNWLTASLNSSSAPATLTLRAARGSLAAGTYTAVVPVTATNAENSPRHVNVTFVVTQTYTLTVNGGGTGNGTVTGDSINCTINSGNTSGRCSARYVSGANVRLSASANTGFNFTGWSGACSGTAACTLTMISNRQVTATFNPPMFTLTVNGAGTGNGVVSGGGLSCTVSNGNTSGTCQVQHPAGTVVQLVGNPALGSSFGGFSGFSGVNFVCSSPPSSTCTVTITGNGSVTAAFQLVPSAAPVISGLTLTGTQLNSPVCAGVGPTLMSYRFDFIDPNGNVSINSVFDVVLSLQPSGATTPYSMPIAAWNLATISGNGAAGTVRFDVCWHFGGNSTARVAVTLYDLDSLKSNTVSLTTPVPAGAPRVNIRGGILVGGSKPVSN